MLYIFTRHKIFSIYSVIKHPFLFLTEHDIHYSICAPFLKFSNRVELELKFVVWTYENISPWRSCLSQKAIRLSAYQLCIYWLGVPYMSKAFSQERAWVDEYFSLFKEMFWVMVNSPSCSWCMAKIHNWCALYSCDNICRQKCHVRKKFSMK